MLLFICNGTSFVTIRNLQRINFDLLQITISFCGYFELHYKQFITHNYNEVEAQVLLTAILKPVYTGLVYMLKLGWVRAPNGYRQKQ